MSRPVPAQQFQGQFIILHCLGFLQDVEAVSTGSWLGSWRG